MRKKETITSHAIVSLKVAFYFIIALWIVEVIQLVGISLLNFGILPRTLSGLLGVLVAPLIHLNIEHLIANTSPFFVFIFLLFFFYKKKSTGILIFIWLVTGLLTWLIGRTAIHIGASGVIYGLASFLIFGGILSRNIKLLLPTVLVIVLYSGLIFGLFPNETQVSWEGHLSGALAGLLAAHFYRKDLRTANRRQ